MLTSMKLTGSPEAIATYHTKEENYYFSQADGVESVLEEGTSPAQSHVHVHGKLAPLLGFQEGQSVTEEELTNMLSGKDAAGNAVCREHKVIGIDLTFSAPKSVSVAALLSIRDPKIVEAHDRAVLETMAEIEKHCAGTRRRFDGELRPVETRNMAFVTVRDGFSRDHDPHLHTHTVVMNMTLCGDRVLALDGQLVMVREFNKLWGGMYRAKLASRLKELGYDISYTKKGEFRMDAVSLEVEKVFSSRRNEIEEQKARGIRDMEAWRKTRSEKDPTVFKKDVVKSWRDRLEQFAEKTPEVNREETVLERERWFLEAKWSEEARQEVAGERRTNEIGRWQLAARRATQGSACVREQAVITEYLAEVGRTEKWAPMTYPQARAALHAQVRAGHILTTEDGYFTTWEMAAADRECIARRDAAQGLSLPGKEARQLVEAYCLAHEKPGRWTVSERQAAVAVSILAEQSGTVVVQGDAGSGKTTMLRLVSEVAKGAGMDIVGVTVQGIAARKLENESGIRSTTMASYLAQERAAERKSAAAWTADRPARMVVIDEASMVDSRSLAELRRLARDLGDKIVLVGDRNQIQSVGAGRPFECLVEAANKDGRLLSLHENYRQRSPMLREAVTLARDGKMRESLDLLDSKGHLWEIQDAVMRRTAIAKEYDGHALILTGTRDSCEDLNRRIRQALISKGELDGKAAREYQVTWTDADGVRHKAYREFAAGDRIQLLDNDYRDHLQVRNGECATIKRLGDNVLWVRHDDGRELKIDLAQYNAMEYGYAVTTYKGQGQTFSRVLVNAETNQPWLQDLRNCYVQITRVRDRLDVFTDDRETLKEIAGVLSIKRDTLELPVEAEQARQMEAKLKELAYDQVRSKTAEAEAHGREAAENLARAFGGFATQGESMEEKRPEPNDERTRDDASSEPSETPRRADRTGDPSLQPTEGRTPASRPVPPSLPLEIASFDSSITGNIGKFKVPFDDKPLEGIAEKLRKELTEEVPPGLSQEQAIAWRLSLLNATTMAMVKDTDRALKASLKAQYFLLERLQYDVERRLMLTGELPSPEVRQAHEAIRQSILDKVAEADREAREAAERKAKEEAARAAEAVKPPELGPVRIDTESLLQAAQGNANTEKVLLEESARLEAYIKEENGRNEAVQRQLAAFFSRPSAAELINTDRSLEMRVAGAEIALGIRPEAEVLEGLSEKEARAAQICAGLAKEALEIDEAQRQNELEGPEGPEGPEEPGLDLDR